MKDLHVVKARIELKDGEPRVVFDVMKHHVDPDGNCSVPPYKLGTYKSESSAVYACQMLNKHTGDLK